MKRITEILASILMAIVNFLKRFTVDLFYALYYKAIELDGEMQQTKTTNQRILTWVGIVVGAIVLLFLLLNLLYTFLGSIVISQDKPDILP